MRKCFACKERIPLGEGAHPYPLDEVDKAALGLKNTRLLLYFHQHHYQAWLRGHIVRRALLIDSQKR